MARIAGRIAAKIAGRTGSLNPETLRRWIERSFIGSVAGSEKRGTGSIQGLGRRGIRKIAFEIVANPIRVPHYFSERLGKLL